MCVFIKSSTKRTGVIVSTGIMNGIVHVKQDV